MPRAKTRSLHDVVRRRGNAQHLCARGNVPYRHFVTHRGGEAIVVRAEGHAEDFCVSGLPGGFAPERRNVPEDEASFGVHRGHARAVDVVRIYGLAAEDFLHGDRGRFTGLCGEGDALDVAALRCVPDIEAAIAGVRNADKSLAVGAEHDGTDIMRGLVPHDARRQFPDLDRGALRRQYRAVRAEGDVADEPEILLNGVQPGQGLELPDLEVAGGVAHDGDAACGGERGEGTARARVGDFAGLQVQDPELPIENGGAPSIIEKAQQLPGLLGDEAVPTGAILGNIEFGGGYSGQGKPVEFLSGTRVPEHNPVPGVLFDHVTRDACAVGAEGEGADFPGAGIIHRDGGVVGDSPEFDAVRIQSGCKGRSVGQETAGVDPAQAAASGFGHRADIYVSALEQIEEVILSAEEPLVQHIAPVGTEHDAPVHSVRIPGYIEIAQDQHLGLAGAFQESPLPMAVFHGTSLEKAQGGLVFAVGHVLLRGGKRHGVVFPAQSFVGGLRGQSLFLLAVMGQREPEMIDAGHRQQDEACERAGRECCLVAPDEPAQMVGKRIGVRAHQCP